MVAPFGSWLVARGRRNHGETQRRTRLQDEREQKGDPCTDVGLIDAKTGEDGGLLVRVCTHHERCGELCSTRHKLGFKTLRPLSRGKFLTQTQHLGACHATFVERYVRALLASLPDGAGDNHRAQLRSHDLGWSMASKTCHLFLGSFNCGFPPGASLSFSDAPRHHLAAC